MLAASLRISARRAAVAPVAAPARVAAFSTTVRARCVIPHFLSPSHRSQRRPERRSGTETPLYSIPSLEY